MKKKDVDLHTSIKLLNIAAVLVLKGAGGGESSTSIWSTCKLVDRAKRGKLVDRANLLYKWPTGRQGQLVDRAIWSTSKASSCWTDRACLILPEVLDCYCFFLASCLLDWAFPSSLSISVRHLLAWL